MSLDDPAVIAGLAVDAQPFFDDPSQAHNRQESTDPERNHDGLLTTDVGLDMDTPMPLKRDAPHIQPISQRPATSSGVLDTSSTVDFGTSFGIGNLPTPSKDADTRELREFWRQYMRTPLSGPQDATGNVSMTNTKNSSPALRRPRVASLPSAKTPMVERDNMYAGFGYHQPDQTSREHAAPVQQGPTSSLRTTLHSKEDLSSYEAAVMARKAPTLNLQLRRPAKAKSVASTNQQIQGQSSRSEARSCNFNPQMGNGSRPPSSSSVARSSTLANAFGEHGNSTVPLASSKSKEGTVSPSLSSSRDVSLDVRPASASSDAELRPPFKRLASQTIGPENSKRTFFGFSADLVEEGDDTAGWSTAVPEVKRLQFGGRLGTGGSIAERRRRRMSAPSSSVETVNITQGGQQPKPTEAAHATGVHAPGYVAQGWWNKPI